ncbi:MAG: sensor histidine kinase [Planctomycetota bacterium]|jgi:signal transduction histidine kinase
MSLQTKILIIVLVVFGLYVTLDHACQRICVLPSFVSLEHNEAKNSMRHCISTLNRKISDLDKLTAQYAASDQIHQLIKRRGDNNAGNTWGIETLSNNNLNLAYICDKTGKVIWGHAVDLQSEKPAQIEINEFPRGTWAKNHHLLGHKKPQSHIAGLLNTKSGPIIIASRPVITQDNKTNIAGTLIMGRFLHGNVLNEIAEQAAVELTVWPIDDHAMPVDAMNALRNLGPKCKFYVQQHADKLLRTYTSMPDLRGEPALLMRVQRTRDIKFKGITELIQSNLFSNVAAGVSVLLVLWLLLRCIVIAPISRLTQHVLKISNGKGLAAQPKKQRRDEIGTLEREFDLMVERLAESRKKLSEQAYYLGKAEVASGVLHNTRNLLTPLVSRIYAVQQQLRDVPIEKLETAQAELNNTNTAASRKEDLNKFIDLSTKTFVSSMKATRDRLTDVARLVGQIEEMLAEQGKFSRSQLPAEQVKLSELLDDSIASLPADVCDTISISIDTSVKAIKPIFVHGMTLLQIFNNILINAAESIRRAGTRQGRICIRANIDDMKSVNMVHVRISDNGEGIESENLTRIFERGYSTRQNMPSGIGLHWCANTIAMMNGRIYAESNGTKHGASFHILFPAQQKTMSIFEKEDSKKS